MLREIELVFTAMSSGSSKKISIKCITSFTIAELTGTSLTIYKDDLSTR